MQISAMLLIPVPVHTAGLLLPLLMFDSDVKIWGRDDIGLGEGRPYFDNVALYCGCYKVAIWAKCHQVEGWVLCVCVCVYVCVCVCVCVCMCVCMCVLGMHMYLIPLHIPPT